jgi:predicted regulator of Ras-like GTPase activity (Roadblock/LC7/MglB family)
VGLRVSEPQDVVFVPGVVTLFPIHLTNSYVGFVTSDINIDGAFGDWSFFQSQGDTFGDVRLGNKSTDNPNIDIMQYDVRHDSQSLSFYMKVDGTFLGGVNVPWNASRPPTITPSVSKDSDGDGILDIYEPGFEHDFDNDAGTPDDPNNNVTPNTGRDGFDRDSDNDGILDWSFGGNDTILEQPVTGKIRFIGPPPLIPKLPVVTGEDVTYVFIDSDANASTGFQLNPMIGADFMINITGRGNVITSRYLSRHATHDTSLWRWEPAGNVSAAVDTRTMEAQIEFSELGVLTNQTFNVWFFSTDWRSRYDLSDNGISETRSSRGTRAPGGGAKVLINEVYPDTNGWVELYNKGNGAKDISDWVISWSGGSYTIPQGTNIASSAFLAFDVGSISDSDTVTLYDDKNKEKDTTTYSSVPSGQGWGRYPDGEESWTYTTPTKGAVNQPANPPPLSNVVVNEIYPDTNGWVELFNTDTAGAPSNIGGWKIFWSGGAYTIPANVKIKPGEFLAFDVGNIPANDTVTLTDEGDVLQDTISHSNIPTGYGWGRYPDGTGTWVITVPTKGGANSIPEFSEIAVPMLFSIFIFGIVRYRNKKGGNFDENGKKSRDKKERNKMGYVKSPCFKEQDNCTFHEENQELKRIVNELSTISDVCGAVLLDSGGEVITQHVKDDISPEQYIDFVVHRPALIQKYIIPSGNNMNSMFNQQIVDYNGHKLLVGRIAPDTILLLLLDKKAYLGLTMLDMEGCLRDMDAAYSNTNT